MASNYNARGRAPEVLVDGDKFEVIRKRESYEDLIAFGKITEPVILSEAQWVKDLLEISFDEFRVNLALNEQIMRENR